jgi:hypothetical protein
MARQERLSGLRSLHLLCGAPSTSGKVPTLSLETVKHTLSSFYPNVQAEAMRIQKLMDDGKIILTGKRDNSDRKLEYGDNQTPAEREESNFNNYRKKYPS